MKNMTKKILGAGVAVALGVGFAGLGATAASAAPSTWDEIGSPQPLYVYSLMTNERVPDGERLLFTDPYFGSPDSANPDQIFADAPADADAVKFFIAPRGQESDMTKWNSSYAITFNPGTRSITNADISLNQFPSSSFAAVRAAGGDYSLGFAFTANNGVTFKGLGAFTHVSIEQTTAAWTFIPLAAGVDNDEATGSPGNIDLEAQVAAPVDGSFSLSVPTGAKATLGAPAWVNNLSTSTGVLPTFSVTDERRVSQKGWDATASVANFTRSGGTETIGAENLRLAPKTVTGTTSAGVTAVAPFQAATAAQPFASAPAGAGLGVTNLSADLTFAAPAGSVQGTYTSKVTVTVVSK